MVRAALVALHLLLDLLLPACAQGVAKTDEARRDVRLELFLRDYRSYEIGAHELLKHRFSEDPKKNFETYNRCSSLGAYILYRKHAAAFHSIDQGENLGGWDNSRAKPWRPLSEPRLVAQQLSANLGAIPPTFKPEPADFRSCAVFLAKTKLDKYVSSGSIK